MAQCLMHWVCFCLLQPNVERGRNNEVENSRTRQHYIPRILLLCATPRNRNEPLEIAAVLVWDVEIVEYPQLATDLNSKPTHALKRRFRRSGT